jgi:hypothetical protein
MKMKEDPPLLVGRLGAEAAVAILNLKGGPMEDRRTRRARSRADAKRKALEDQSSS